MRKVGVHRISPAYHHRYDRPREYGEEKGTGVALSWYQNPAYKQYRGLQEKWQVEEARRLGLVGEGPISGPVGRAG